MSLMSTMSIGERIKGRREQRGLTQKDLASALQVSAQAVSKWERGENAPDIALLVELTRLLGVSTDWLLGVHATPRDLFEASILVVDIAGVSARMQRVGVRDAISWVNGRLYQITEAVLAFDAVPVKYLGDGFLCFLAGAQHRDRAVGAALHLREMVSDPVRIGLASGEVYLCSIGHPDYAGRDLEGEAVRHAFWTEAWTKQHTTSGMAATASLLDGLSQPVRIGEGQQLSLPNGTGSLVVHEVLGS